MNNSTESIGEVFLLAWEKGLRIDVGTKQNIIKCYRELSNEELLCVGWDHNEPPIEADDVDFFTQYIEFKKIYSSIKA